MEQDAASILKKQLEKLPPEAREAVTSVKTQRAIQTIGTKYGLHIDQVGVLEDETLLIMLGLTDPSTFPDMLEERLHVTAANAQAIAIDINDSLFMPIRQAMQQFVDKEQNNEPEPLNNISPPSELASSDIWDEPDTPTPSSTSAQTDITPVDHLLAQPSSSVSPASSPSQPASYKADPYREPVDE